MDVKPDIPQDYLLGYLSFDGVKQESPKYPQGPDITFTVELKDNGEPARLSDYNVLVILKTDLTNNIPVWTGYPGNGIFQDSKKVKIKIPGNVTVNLLPGIYYLTVLGTAKKDLTHDAVLYNANFTIESTAADQPVSSPFQVVCINDNPLPNEGSFVDIGYTGNL